PAIVYLALQVRELAPGDTLLVEWRRDGAVVARGSVSGRALADEWVVFPYAVPDGPAHYEVDARVNGAVVRALAFEGR
ncbi:MAG: hypothetical protein IRY97_07705, partial [Thermomicrobiaceae bacterium]|nr:hypothetical protein [Thermomicrobiaceae bacterium]